MAPRRQRICTYEIDARYQLVRVGGAWARFAIENAAPELAQPIGPPERTLFSYITDETTREVYRALFSRVRKSGRPITVPFRCDAPSLRRFLELKISPLESAGFRLESVLVRSEPRPYLSLIDAAYRRSQELLRMCGWCKAVDANGDWVEPERGVTLLNLFERDALPQITHGMCESCYERMTGAMA